MIKPLYQFERQSIHFTDSHATKILFLIKDLFGIKKREEGREEKNENGNTLRHVANNASPDYKQVH